MGLVKIDNADKVNTLSLALSLVLFVAFILIVSLVAIGIFASRFDRTLQAAPTISLMATELDPKLKVSVIIPAYNEAANIEACITAVLDSTTLSANQLEVWVIDDQSTDDTLTIAQLVQDSRHDDRLKILAGAARPIDQTWVGKNWACTQAARSATGDFLLFVDADVRLKLNSIETTIAYAELEKIDLFSMAITIICRHWSEWLVQPIILSLLAVGFDFAIVNDPKHEAAFAAGPFMLFRRSAYDAIGGHAAVREYVVEDVQLARRIKQQGLKLWYGLAHGLAEVQMYRSFAALWEGWTKNWFMGSNRNYQAAFYCVFATLMIFVMPWFGAIVGVIDLAIHSINIGNLSVIGLSAIGIFLQYWVRRQNEPFTRLPPRYWWLTGVGGLLLCAIVLVSIVKTETGWGWTWRGRNLAKTSESVS